jgi:hypothetical protein
MVVWTLCAGVALIVLAIGSYFISANWPYRYRKIHPLLEDVFASQVKITHYHRTYFPHPGFVATGLILRRKSALNMAPLGFVETMSVEGRWSDLLLLRKKVHLVEVTGMHIIIPAIGSSALHQNFPAGSSADFTGPDTFIERCEVHNALLDMMHDDNQRFSFYIRELDLNNLYKGQAVTYALDMENAKPSGHIQAKGSFGPLNAKNVEATPISGMFNFSSVRLHDLGDIRGTLSSSGHFNGDLSVIQADVSSLTPDFSVEEGEATSVAASCRCTVNALNGDVALQTAEAKSSDTIVHVSGSVAGNPKVANIDFDVKKGRAQDLLRAFVHGGSPITGPVWLHGHAYVGPVKKGAGFLKRLRLNGVFDVPAERITDRSTERSLSAFSLRARDIDSPNKGDSNSSATTDELSSIRGPAEIRDGIVSTRGLIFEIPGANAGLGGTFDLESKSVHLVGTLRMKADISHATTGFKSILLKPFAIFFKKKHAGAVVPIAVTGSPGHYSVSQDLSHQK